MSQFTSTVVFEKEFDGDKITFTLKRLKVSHMTLLSGYLSKNTEDNKEKLVFSDHMELLSVAQKILPECVVSMSGLMIEGNPAKLETIIEEAYFIPLVGAIVTHLLKVSSIKEQDAKKSENPSPE